MTLPVLLRRAAELDLAAIEDWYESQRHGLSGEFRQVVDDAIALIADSPLAFPERYHGARRVLLRRLPYAYGTDHLTTSWLSSHACTGGVILERSAPVFAGASNSGMQPTACGRD